MDKLYPQIGHMLFDCRGLIGMVLNVYYIHETSLYLVEIEWIVGKLFQREVYRVGEENNNAGKNIMKLSEYTAMRQAYRQLKAKHVKA